MNDSFIFKTKIVGSSFRDEIDEAITERIKAHEVELQREPDNAFDKNAIKCVVRDIHVGYIPKELAAKLSLLLDLPESSYQVNWIGPGKFDIEVYVEAQNGLAIIDPRAYTDQLLSNFAATCAVGSPEEVLILFQELKESSLPSWHLMNQSQPILEAVKGNNLKVLELLLKLGFSHNGNQYEALRLSVKSHSNNAYALITKRKISSAGSTYALLEAYDANNRELVEELSQHRLSKKILRERLEAAVTDRSVDLVIFILSFELPVRQLESAFLKSAQIGASLILREFIKISFDSDVIYRARIAAIENSHSACVAALLRDQVSPKGRGAYFKLAIFKQQRRVALAILKLGIDETELVDIVYYLICQSHVVVDPLSELAVEVYKRMSNEDLIEVISLVSTHKQVERLVRLFDLSPLNIAAYSNQRKLKNNCLTLYQAIKSDNYRSYFARKRPRYLHLVEIKLTDTELPYSIAHQLEQFGIDNVFDLKVNDEPTLRLLVGLSRIELNEIDFFMENMSFEKPSIKKSTLVKAMAKEMGVYPRIHRSDLEEKILILEHLVECSFSERKQPFFHDGQSAEEIEAVLVKLGFTIPYEDN
ncbi:HIRAN domain-containing protein [Pseudidiomarina terrestris]|uniref:HIRAN domain-containing protein n=1 Tax=Pseudidiomarina terrestris TaxID=2820060 RepID=UPI0026569C02|nr:HIRAN domain-containing protein [Pseudidiomarina sp. 1ASP75-5]MDN7135369.1 HIRAN domain-containing protein [Pseudidiomarina sp. 1ASP75-5]